jgi:hypothetical protein
MQSTTSASEECFLASATDSLSTMNVYRVTVRGQFGELSSRIRSSLLAAVDDHDIFKSSFTDEGTFTYDDRLQFFNLRYELRLTDPGDPSAIGLARAEEFLRVLKIPHRRLRAAVMDLSEIVRSSGSP